MRIKGKVTADESAVAVHYRPATSYVIECFRVTSDSVASVNGTDEEQGRQADEQSSEKKREKKITLEAENKGVKRRCEFPRQPETSRSR